MSSTQAAAQSFPDAWSVVGTWGVDALQDTAQILGAPTSVKIPSGRTVKLISQMQQINTFSASPNNSGRRYAARNFFYSDNVLNSLTVVMNVYAANRTTLNSSVTLFSGTTSVINQWLCGTANYNSASTDVWVQFVITVASANSGNLWFGGFELNKLNPMALVDATGVSVTGGTLKSVAYTAPFVLGEVDVGTPAAGGAVANSGLFLKAAGVWQVFANVVAPATMNTGQNVTAQLIDGITGSVLTRGGPYVQFSRPFSAGAVASVLPFNFSFYLTFASNPKGYPIVLQLNHSDGANARLFNVNLAAYFQG